MSADNKTIRLADFAHRIDLSVRWGDADMFGHVNNAKYFTYVESGRIDYLETLGAVDGVRSDAGGSVILASIGADFIAQVRYPAQLVVGTRITKIGRSSLGLLNGVFLGEQLVLAARGTMVWFDYASQKAAPVPDHVRAAILAREVIAPEM
ncbi:MAG: thioesterase family protein [Gammaproteobacteria bacterium]|uniref:acyl-CoA thioesterase n=1 Tax=Nevskia sp. TaxID=1929292 RepID=UPI004036D9CC|nr:thioesterase family protein [Gammaproteobacteria bacterium]